MASSGTESISALELKVQQVAERLPTDLDGFRKVFERMNYYTDGSGPDEIQDDLDSSGYKHVLYGCRADGSGNSDSVWVIPANEAAGQDLRALWTYYDNESALGFYSADKSEAYDQQISLYAGIPNEFLPLLENRVPKTPELLHIADPNTEDHIYYASVALLLENGEWKALPGYLQLAVSLSDDGGLNSIFDEKRYR